MYKSVCIFQHMSFIQSLSLFKSVSLPESVCCDFWQLAYDIDKDAEDQNMYIDGMVRSAQDYVLLFILPG